jgi:hypothetical protein
MEHNVLVFVKTVVMNQVRRRGEFVDYNLFKIQNFP